MPKLPQNFLIQHCFKMRSLIMLLMRLRYKKAVKQQPIGHKIQTNMSILSNEHNNPKHSQSNKSITG